LAVQTRGGHEGRCSCDQGGIPTHWLRLVSFPETIQVDWPSKSVRGYGNEKDVGEGIRQSGFSRSDLFVGPFLSDLLSFVFCERGKTHFSRVRHWHVSVCLCGTDNE
jgi:hypothetical protein